MASRNADHVPSEVKVLTSVSEELSQCGPDEISEEVQSDATNATVKSQKPGKFRRTALTFFGVRKSICILPSFFGGRSKNQNKWSSKKGLTKSRTHDGLSKAGHDDDRYTSAGDYACAGGCQNEFIHLNVDQKSLTLGRQKKGLRSLFNSFKHHRNYRNVGLDKTEMVAMSSSCCKKELPVVQDNTKQYVTECLVSEPDVPVCPDVTCDFSIGPESSDADAVALEEGVEPESPKSEPDDQTCVDQMEELKLMASSEYEEISRGHSEPCLRLQTTSEPLLKCETPTGSSDQLNQMFGDVASLKSFDSLTGCGDIIADQEDDSLKDSTVSGERSRNGGKRASCYLTYQGGGEEMASPEDLDEECLQDFWGSNASEDVCCTCNQDHTDVTCDLTSAHNVNSNGAQQASGMDTSSITDVLTPQSEHQESVPNSDEGYYDSTTPGPDESQDKPDRLRTDRLPRDSYSGDALYELFAPDESLISPRYENKSKLPGSNLCDYLNSSVDVSDSSFVPEMNRLQISPELYQVHKFVETPNTRCKTSELAQIAVSRQETGINKSSKLISKPQASHEELSKSEQGGFDEKENALDSPEKGEESTNADSDERRGSALFGDADFEAFCETKEHHLEENKPVALPYRNISCQPADCNRELNDEHTVCFSQALEDYTKHSQMLSNLHNSVDDLETGNSAFTPNMEALPTIVTFDVVDMHNEGEYDEEIHMELEEDISPPYQEFEESYLQKDAFAECDYQMLDLYEQNLISNTWAVASLPRHLGLTRVSQYSPNPLTPERRSRSLDRESLELKMSDTYRQNRAAAVRQTEKPTERRNVLMSASWQTRSEMALSLSLTDGDTAEKAKEPNAQAKLKLCSASSSSGCPNVRSQHCSGVSDSPSCEVPSQNPGSCSKPCRLPLPSDARLPHGTFVYSKMAEDVSDGTDDDDVFCKDAVNLPPYKQCNKSRPVVSREGLCHTKDERSILSETRRDVTCIMACSKLPEATFN